MNLKASEFIPHTVLESGMDTDGYLDFGGKVFVLQDNTLKCLNQLFLTFSEHWQIYLFFLFFFLKSFTIILIMYCI